MGSACLVRFCILSSIVSLEDWSSTIYYESLEKSGDAVEKVLDNL